MLLSLVLQSQDTDAFFGLDCKMVQTRLCLLRLALPQANSSLIKLSFSSRWVYVFVSVLNRHFNFLELKFTGAKTELSQQMQERGPDGILTIWTPIFKAAVAQHYLMLMCDFRD